MGKVFADQSLSLDGFSTGAAVVGRHTFDLGEKPWGDDPPFYLPVSSSPAARRRR